MQFAVITGPSEAIAIPRIRLANTLKDGVELRLDLFNEVTLEIVKKLRSASTNKVIFTLRRKSFSQEFMTELLTLEPDYVDFEHGTDLDFLNTVKCKIISSYHNFDRTPKDLESIFKKMQNPHAYAYKICTSAQSISDAYRMLTLIQTLHKKGIRIIGLCMGDEGRITREDGIKAGNYLNYTVLHKQDICARGLHFT